VDHIRNAALHQFRFHELFRIAHRHLFRRRIRMQHGNVDEFPDPCADCLIQQIEVAPVVNVVIGQLRADACQSDRGNDRIRSVAESFEGRRIRHIEFPEDIPASVSPLHITVDHIRSRDFMPFPDQRPQNVAAQFSAGSRKNNFHLSLLSGSIYVLYQSGFISVLYRSRFISVLYRHDHISEKDFRIFLSERFGKNIGRRISQSPHLILEFLQPGQILPVSLRRASCFQITPHAGQGHFPELFRRASVPSLDQGTGHPSFDVPRRLFRIIRKS